MVVPVLLPLLPAKARRFIEPFVGSGAVFLNTNYPINLLSDSNKDIIGLYRVLKRKGDEFIERCRRLFVPNNNDEARFYEFRREFNQCSDPERRAALFVYLNRHCFNGLCRYNQRGEFNTPFGRYTAPQLPEKAMHAFALKLRTADLATRDFREVLNDAGKGDVVYCDPPYAPLSATAYFTSYSAAGFGPQDQMDLAIACSEAASRGAVVLVSNHDTKFTRELYKGADKIVELLVSRTISCDGQNRSKAMELIARFGGLGARPPESPPRKLHVAPQNERLENSDKNNGPADCAMKLLNNSARQWLLDSGYEDISETIDKIIMEWHRKGVSTRRDWWDVLAGTPKGSPRVVEGVKFPVLAAARARKGWSPVDTAICRKREQPIPAVVKQARWHNLKKP
jgi:DNA adenine methylase